MPISDAATAKSSGAAITTGDFVTPRMHASGMILTTCVSKSPISLAMPTAGAVRQTEVRSTIVLRTGGTAMWPKRHSVPLSGTDTTFFTNNTAPGNAGRFNLKGMA